VLIPIRLVPLISERVWGGTRLRQLVDRAPEHRAPGTLPIGELWVAGPWTEVAAGRWAGRTLEDAAQEAGADLVGSAAPGEPGPRFPLLVKLLDPAAWLSVQVHPDDAAARALAGPDAVGKTEAWYVIEADPGAELLVGVRPSVRQADLREAIRRGAATTDLLTHHEVAAGDAILISAGTLHSVGPGILMYEVQQPSDLTYRVDDWGRAATPTRPLHTAEALASVVPDSRPALRRGGAAGRLASCSSFTLDLADAPVRLDPGGRTLHVVTAVTEALSLSGAGWDERLEPLDTLVVPASAGAYDLLPDPGGQALVAALP
jgi:mannose-6-phosphate isomerase